MKKRIESVLSQSDAVAEKWLHLHAYTLFVMVAAACVLELAGGYLLNAIEGFVNSSLQRYLIKYIAIPITTNLLLALVAFIGPDGFTNIINACISMVIAFIVIFVLVWLYGYQDVAKQETEGKAEEVETAAEIPADHHGAEEKEEIVSIADGNIIPLSEVPDPTFAGEILGKGAAVQLESDEIYSPVDGTVASVFPTKHAIGLLSDDGVEVLIHVGIDTVQLEGRHYDVKVEAGQKVKKGDLLLVCDREAIEKEGYQTVTPIIISNTADFDEVQQIENGKVKKGTPVIRVK